MKYIIGVVACAVLVFFDQITKNWAAANLSPRGRREFINGFLGFTYHENAGAAFGILQGWRWFFVAFLTVVLAAIIYFYIKLPKDRLSNWTRALMVILTAGALGNGIDRARQGFVVDFLVFEFVNFPVFNLADVFIVGSIFPLAVIILFFYKEKPKEKKPEPEEPDAPDS